MAKLGEWLGRAGRRRWPGTWSGGAAAMGVGAALGGLPPGMLAALGTVSVLLAAFSAFWAFMQYRNARARGTVYVIREHARGWEDDEAHVQEFLHSMARDFPAVRLVPGPAALHGWPWPLGAGAQDWDERVDELVTALRVVRKDDQSESLKSVIAWARWPVAVAAMSRMLAAERGPGLAVRQRVSYGRAAEVDPVVAFQPALLFDPVLDLPSAAAGALPLRTFRRGRTSPVPPPAEEIEHRGTMTIVRKRKGAGQRPRPTKITRVTILLVRLSAVSWGPLPPLYGAQVAASAVAATQVADAAGIGVSGTVDYILREWRCLPPPGNDPAAHKWEDFEALAHGAVRWISDHAKLPPEEVLLLGASIPQEIGLGIGIHVRRMDETQWPGRLYPMVWDADEAGFVIPNLDLGWASLRQRPGGQPRRNTSA